MPAMILHSSPPAFAMDIEKPEVGSDCKQPSIHQYEDLLDIETPSPAYPGDSAAERKCAVLLKIIMKENFRLTLSY